MSKRPYQPFYKPYGMTDEQYEYEKRIAENKLAEWEWEQEQEKLERLKGERTNEIKIGDMVSVNFNNAQITLCKNAEVLHIPCDTGDSWQFRDVDTNEIHYISEGCTITLSGIKESK